MNRLFRLSDDDLPFVLLFVALAAFACAIPAQSDTFYHLRSGRAMWETGWLLERETFSHTAHGLRLHNHWWLSQLAFYGLYELGGPPLLTAAAGACAFFALYLSWRLVRGTVEIRLLLLLGLLLVVPQWSVRPQVFSMILLMILVRLVIADRLVWVPPLLLVWANAHALVVMGVAVACAVAVASTYSTVGGLWEFGFRHDPDRPLESIARHMLQWNVTNRNFLQRYQQIRRYVEEWHADALVIHSVKSCRLFSAGQGDMREYFTKELNVPTLLIESDLEDPRYFSEAQLKNRIDAFFESLEHKKMVHTGAQVGGAA